ncbi:enoyl-CoA hydratase/isomerase family protein [Sphingomonas endophytica]|uniref:Enoyl-CoA hydratase/carnithine racemase n=1 Tax=Sphingomonas endophytica TaxID=869719 RepID=A0ABR6N794_9SPHN|nr:enoyl-CoA hydratase [Sphingomonas endophytica]MBB5726675.1 enoyl-CoA hydratase/carnithine racemase [Sphingomonas endophytica]
MSGVVVTRDGAAVHVRFDNPAAHNALTGAMWLALRDAARTIADDPGVRVVTFRGTGGKAFISGTDISKFADYRDGAQGVAYEREIDECMAAVDAIPCTTIAVVEGWAVGGGLNISAACDFRIATPDARFGSPIGRTIGNCLSAASVARIGSAVSVSVARRMVLLGEIVGAEELRASGFLLKVVERDALDAEIAELCARAIENAPLTTRVTKETLRRMTFDALPAIEPLIEQVYGSADFRRGVADFLAKTKRVPAWRGE